MSRKIICAANLVQIMLKKIYLNSLVLLSFLLLANPFAAAQNQAAEYGSKLIVQGPKGYKAYSEAKTVGLDKFDPSISRQFLCDGKKPCADSVPGFKQGKFIAEGKLTSIIFEQRDSNKRLGDLAILKSYEAVFNDLGGRKLTSNEAPVVGEHLFYLEKNNSRIWISVGIFGPALHLAILEEKAFESVVTAGQLAESISKQGFATLRINFDTNKTVVKSEAKPAIDEVITLLKKDASLKLSVEGHTDNVGKASANKTLSQGRAQSVVQALVQGGIDAKRLEAKGFGNEAPIADNRTDDGKEKNRRVELVKVK